jgi:parallel beta-helix repeat protein
MNRMVLILVLLPIAASAATLTVNSVQDNTTAGDGRCTLREAVANVNAAADTTGGDCVTGTGAGDEITFSVRIPGTLHRDWALGPLALQRDVTITGPATGRLSITGGGKTRVFEIAAGTTQISGVTISSGRADRGGGVLVDSGASLVLVNCGVKANVAVLGAGIYNDGGTVTASGCTLSGNRVNNNAGDGRGGALYNTGTASLSGCTLHGNQARGHGGSQVGGGQGYGGAVSNLGTLNVASSLVSGNSAIGTNTNQQSSGGGGLYNEGTATFRDSTFRRNIAKNGGGGVFSIGTLSLSNSTVRDNRSGISGGGIRGSVTLTNCTIAGNRARYSGGGLSVSDNTVLTNCTVIGNHATNRTEGGGGGIYGSATFINTILANNTAAEDKNCEGSGSDGGHNLENADTCHFTGSGGCSFGSSGTSQCNTNPQLAPAGLKDNGGPTQTIALCTAPGTPTGCTGASPAIDAGDDSVTGPPDNLTTDQRGTRHRDWALGALTLQRDVTITGPATGRLNISGGGKTRVFEIAAGTTQMSGVTIRSGRADRGGGVLVDSGGSLSLVNCGVKGNIAVLGAGICNDGGTVTANGCALSGNRANNNAGDGRGGAMYNAGTASLSYYFRKSWCDATILLTRHAAARSSCWMFASRVARSAAVSNRPRSVSW